VAQVGPDRPLTLYLMDHGIYDQLYLDKPSGQWVTPVDLDGWLDQLEQAVPGVKVNVVVEACYSGSFIDLEKTVSNPGRVIIASTSESAVAYARRRARRFRIPFSKAWNRGLVCMRRLRKGRGPPDRGMLTRDRGWMMMVTGWRMKQKMDKRRRSGVWLVPPFCPSRIGPRTLCKLRSEN